MSGSRANNKRTISAESISSVASAHLPMSFSCELSAPYPLVSWGAIAAEAAAAARRARLRAPRAGTAETAGSRRAARSSAHSNMQPTCVRADRSLATVELDGTRRALRSDDANRSVTAAAVATHLSAVVAAGSSRRFEVETAEQSTGIVSCRVESCRFATRAKWLEADRDSVI